MSWPAADLGQMLARVTGRPALASAPPDTPLLGEGGVLDSLTGTLLLREVHRQLGADVAADDLNLDSMATLGTLAEFVRAAAGSQHQGGGG